MKTVSKKLFSLMLVAILLVSALPFQAFADPHVNDDPNHMLAAWTNDGTDGGNHWQVCPKSDCDDAGTKYNETPHSYADGVCVTCGYHCTHAAAALDPSTAVAPTCVNPGKLADKICPSCHLKLEDGAVDPATGVHTYNANNVCTVCGATQLGAEVTLKLDANGGTISGAAAVEVKVNIGSPIKNLPDPYKQGYTFAGWFVGETQVYLGQNYPFTTDMTAVAKWTEVTQQLTVRRVLNGDYSTAKTILTVNLPMGTPLLTYLNTNVYSTVTAELALTPGFSWQYNFWKDYSGTQPLTSQADCMNQAQTIFVNFVSNAYTLYFNANGGVVTPTSKSVYFGSPVGTLPTASLEGKVFQGWKDPNGNMYTADTVYQVAGDTSLTAVWKDEALVLLYVYINGDFSSVNRVIVMDGFVKDNNISRSDVVAQVSKYYTPASGYLNIAGLFDDYSWSSYRANTGKAGVENIQISSAHPNKVYVMVTNASTAATLVNGTTSSGTGIGGTGTGTVVNGTYATSPVGAYWVSTGNGTGYWVYPAAGTNNGAVAPTYIYYGTNPKTGDNAMIELAAAVMVLAAGALVTIMTLRKKKMI